jgi:hypothetical protein
LMAEYAGGRCFWGPRKPARTRSANVRSSTLSGTSAEATTRSSCMVPAGCRAPRVSRAVRWPSDRAYRRARRDPRPSGDGCVRQRRDS